MPSPSPVAVFAFNRPDHLRQTLTALAANDLAPESAVTVFCDGPRNPTEASSTSTVRRVAHTAQGFASVEVIERAQNMGCAASIIAGLEHMFARHERLIVIEDDILTSPYTLRFLNTCLDKYESCSTVFNISAWSPPPHLMPIDASYPYDTYCIPRFNCWGWATWKNRWEKTDWNVTDYATFAATPALQQALNAGGADLSPMLAAQMTGKINSWAVRLDYCRFKQGCVGVNPVISYAANIGMDGSGTHCGDDIEFSADISKALPEPSLLEHIFVDKQILKAYQSVFSPPPPSLAHRLIKIIQKILLQAQR